MVQLHDLVQLSIEDRTALQANAIRMMTGLLIITAMGHKVEPSETKPLCLQTGIYLGRLQQQ